jgi:thiamine biosynthesis protein ThiS
LRITVNGEQREVADGTTGAELLCLLQIPAVTAVAEYNGIVQTSAVFQGTVLVDGDLIELVTLVGGG